MSVLVDIPFDKGVNLLDDPRKIEDGELVEAKNLVPWEPGILSTRPAGKIERLVDELSGRGYPLTQYVIPFPEFGRDFIYAFRDVVNNVNTTLKTGYFVPGGSTESQDMGAITRIQPAIIGYNNVVYAFGGYPCPTAGYKFQDNGGGSFGFTEFTFGGTGNADIRPSVVGVYRDRFVYGDLGPGYESSLLMADRFLPASVKNSALAANGGTFDVNPNDGDRIVAITEITQTAVGSPTQSACLVLKGRSAFILTGEPAESSGSFSFDDFTVNALSYECGCASAATLCKTPYGWFWAGPDDVWFFATGQVPVRVGTKIRKALERTPAATRYKWHAAYFNGFYRLAIAAEGQGPNDDSPMQEQFWLDLRNGPPANFRDARWWGPMTYKFVTPGVAPYESPTTILGTYNMTVAARPDQELGLFGLVEGVASGASNYIYSVSFDTAEGDDSSLGFPLYTAWQPSTAYVLNDKVYNSQLSAYVCIGAAGTSDAANEPTDMTGRVVDSGITWRYIGPATFYAFGDTGSRSAHIVARLKSKVFDFGEPMTRKIFQVGEVDIAASNTCEFEWTVLFDNGQNETQSNPAILRVTPAEFGVDEFDSAVLAEEFQSVAFHPLVTSTRPIGKLFQLEITNTTTPRYPIVTGFNDQLVVGSIDGVGDFETPILCTLDGDVAYSSVDTLLSALQVAIQGATGLAFTTQRADNGVVEVVPPSGFRFVLARDDASIAIAGADASRVLRASAMLGFDRFTQYYPNLQDASTVGTSPVRYYAHSTWQIGGIKLRIQPINRRPT